MPVSNAPLSLVAECWTLSLFVHVTVVPESTVIVEGENAKPDISTLTVPAAGCGATAGGDATGCGVGDVAAGFWNMQPKSINESSSNTNIGLIFVIITLICTMIKIIVI